MTPAYDNLHDRAHEQAKRGINPLTDTLLGPLMRASPSMFGYVMLTGPDDAPFNGRFITGEHHAVWDRMVVDDLRYCAVASRGLGKTVYFCLCVPIWEAVMFPGHSSLLIGSSDDNVKKLIQDIKDEIETNPLLQWLKPRRNAGSWGSHLLSFSTGATLAGRSVGSRLRGWHPDRTHADDILTEEAKRSEAYLRKTANYWYSVIVNLPLRRQRLGMSGTTLSRRDLIHGSLRENKSYHYIVFPILKEDGTSQWPEAFTLDDVDAKRQEMGSLVFDTECMCRPISDETSLFPIHLFENEQMVHSAIMSSPAAFAAADLRVFIGVDLAFSTNESADYFVIFVLGLDALGNFWWLDMHRERGVAYIRQMHLIKEYWAKWEAERVYIESNAAQQILGDEAIRTSSMPVKKFNTNTNKYSFEGGVPALRRMAENHKFRIPRGDAASREIADLILYEMGGFTFDENSHLLSLGEHDDTVMALWMAWVAASRGSGMKAYIDDGGAVDRAKAAAIITAPGPVPAPMPPPSAPSIVDPGARTLYTPPSATEAEPMPNSRNQGVGAVNSVETVLERMGLR